VSTDIEQRCREAITGILDADAGVRALTKRTTKNCVPGRDGLSIADPVITLQFLGMTEIGGAGDNRRPRYRLTCWARGNGAQRIANELAERIEQSITQPALSAAGIDGYPLTRSRSTGPLPETPPGETVGRADLDLTLIATK
jgi:hypothetical protein